MNKKGFTITEVVVTIGLLLLLAILVIPNLINQDTKTKKKLYEDRIIIAKNAAYDYAKDNIDSLSVNCEDVTIEKLMRLKYLSGTDDYGYDIKNPITGESMKHIKFCIRFIDNAIEVSEYDE